jgi:hypothetical protein
MRRTWVTARGKVEAEGVCRLHLATIYGACDGPLEAAHVVGRVHDQEGDVVGEDIVPLCRRHHAMYDARSVDLLPFLTITEQTQAVCHVGIVRAYQRTTGQRLDA